MSSFIERVLTHIRIAICINIMWEKGMMTANPANPFKSQTYQKFNQNTKICNTKIMQL